MDVAAPLAGCAPDLGAVSYDGATEGDDRGPGVGATDGGEDVPIDATLSRDATGGPDATPSLDRTPPRDATPVRDALLISDVSPGRDVPPPDAAPGCAGSASGSSAIWTCTTDRTARQRCTAGAVETQRCAFGACIPRPTGTPDECPPDPATNNASAYCTGGACVHWWNCRVTYQYQYPSSHDWDTDFHMVDGTPIALPHAAVLTAVSLVGSGFQPEFTDLVSGEWMHFNHLHLNSEFGGDDHAIGPVQLVSLTDAAHPDHVYPAGWVVGFSGGGTTRTGYLGTDASGNVCTGGHSTAAHFCAVTHAVHPIDYYLPVDAGGCPTAGWPSALWSTIHPMAPRYASCPSTCNACGVSHF